MKNDTLDLLICTDDTGSMSSVRKQVKQKLVHLLDDLFEKIPNIRIGIQILNDYCDGKYALQMQDFSSDRKSIEQFLDTYSPCGGGDSDECYELALNKAQELNWKSEKRAFILIGDASPHEPGYRYGSIVNNLDWRKEADKLNDMNVQIFGVQALGYHGSTNFYETVSRKTGGVKLDLSQLNHIIQYITAIAYQQSGQLETYEESDPSFKTNLALKNMFNKLKGKLDDKNFSDKIELLSRFQVMNVDDACQIREFVEKNGLHFKKGAGFYQMMERINGKANSEEIQPNKEVIFVDKSTGETISDVNWCREKLGVPFGTRGKVHEVNKEVKKGIRVTEKNIEIKIIDKKPIVKIILD